MVGYAGPIVDVDIHHRPKSAEEWVPYLSNEWKVKVAGRIRPMYPIYLPSGGGSLTSNGARRRDLFQEPGLLPGYNVESLQRTLLDPYNIWRGLLTHDVGEFEAGLNPYFTVDVCRAINDWNLDTWLTYDDRLYGLIVVPTALPHEAAKEIRRVGGSERYAGVLLASNGMGKQFGDPVFDPLYEAALDMGLSISIHHSILNDRTAVQAGGPVWGTPESASQAGQKAMHIISSFIVHGTFERFPGLHVVIKEFGISWLPSLMWRLDGEYDLLRRESPWVKKLPSEYIHQHVRLSTQPIEDTPNRNGLRDLLETVDGIEDILCFSSDFPHFTMDDPTYVARVIPRTWHRKVFCENGAAAFGWIPPPEGAAVRPVDSVKT